VAQSPDRSPPPTADSLLEELEDFDFVDDESPGDGPVPGGLFASRYQIEALLGRGGMGAVYRALDTLVGDRLALKTLDLGRGASASAIDRFKREVRLARRISHPNVARVHDLGEHAGLHYLTMEYVEGGDLDGLLEREKQLPLERAVRIALAVADGLGAAHAAGVIHRDLKPANVLVDRAGRIVLTDFGIARGLIDEAALHRTVGTVGTPLYMAPEQVQGLAVDARTDVYALGLLIYEMIVGTHAFQADTPIATAIARLYRPAPDPRAAVSVDDALAELVLACLSREPEGRPADGRAVADALRQWLVARGLGGDTGQRPLAGTVGEPRATGAASIDVTAHTEAHPRGLVTAAATPISGAAGAAVSQSLPGLGRSSRALAVLPFRYRGPSEHAYLGDGLAEELIDVLSRTRGLRVKGSGATARFRDERDPKTVGEALGVDAIVDGSVQSVGDRLRVSVRLVEVASGTQLWSDKFEAPLEELFEVQETVSRRVAEALRVSIDAGATRGDAPAEAVEAYMRGRRALSLSKLGGPGGAVSLFEGALALAPTFTPAIAAHAVATLRAWFTPGESDPRNWAQEVERSVERAKTLAPDVADTQLAAGLYAVHTADYAEAGRALSRALAIAPTFAAAHHAFGQIAAESGHLQRGMKHLRTAIELDPTLELAFIDLARSYALGGDREASRRVLARHEAEGHLPPLPLRMRIAAWYGELDELRNLLPAIEESSQPLTRFAAIYARLLLGQMTTEAGEALFEAKLPTAASPRFIALAMQSGAEIFAAMGDLERAESYLARAVSAGFVDLEWLDRCPMLSAVRGRPAFVDARRQCRQRAEAFWSTVHE
jgi:serine/threonine-protein kinase